MPRYIAFLLRTLTLAITCHLVMTGNAQKIIFKLDDIEVLSIEKNDANHLRFDAAYSNRCTFFGFDSGRFSSEELNTGFGAQTLRSAGFTGRGNSAFGANALYSLTTGDLNTAVGSNALSANSEGFRNTAVGHSALLNVGGSYNTAVGTLALGHAETGEYNVGIGHLAGNSDDANSSFNVYIGNQAGSKSLINTTIKHRNVMVGYQAGEMSEGDANVFLGYRAGRNETGDNKLYIHNTDAANPLIYGDFSTRMLEVNGTFHVDGDDEAAAIVWDNDQGSLWNSHDALKWQRPRFNIFLDSDNNNNNTTNQARFALCLQMSIIAQTILLRYNSISMEVIAGSTPATWVSD